MRWTNVSRASFQIGPLPVGTKRIALYLPSSPRGAAYSVSVDGKQVYAGTTLSSSSSWVSRTMLPAEGGKTVKLSVGDIVAPTTQFSISGVTLFSDDGL